MGGRAAEAAGKDPNEPPQRAGSSALRCANAAERRFLSFERFEPESEQLFRNQVSCMCSARQISEVLAASGGPGVTREEHTLLKEAGLFALKAWSRIVPLLIKLKELLSAALTAVSST